MSESALSDILLTDGVVVFVFVYGFSDSFFFMGSLTDFVSSRVLGMFVLPFLLGSVTSGC